jgi:glycosyltransferase involved in cell wall biosynthesis
VSDLVIDLSGIDPLPEPVRRLLPQGSERIDLDALRDRGAWTALRRLRARSFDRCVVVVSEFRTPTRWLSMVLLALLSRARQRILIDRHGQQRRPSWSRLLSEELPFAVGRARLGRQLSRQALAGCHRLRPAGQPRGLRPSRVALIRPDLGPALTAGGSLAHIRGVVRGFQRRGCDVTLLSPAPLSGVGNGSVRVCVVPEDERFRVSVELPHLAYNATLMRRGGEILEPWRPDVIYQRHALGCYAGAGLAQSLGLPLVVEYNGPEVWIGRHWGSLTHFGELFETIEKRTLQAADLIVAVSQPLVEQLIRAGVPRERILVNPNGVDAERFEPEALRDDRERIRERLGVDGETVVAGFVGTFGPWHGAEVLARAIGRLDEPTLARTHFVFIGDGPRRGPTEAILEHANRLGRSTFTGTVGFDDIPAYLSAFDLCLSPHVPNVDGSPFFGSPTKLFEYLASGRAVLASDLGQIGEVLEHGVTAWLVPPGDVDALAHGLSELVGRPELRAELGRAGRDCARRRHSWSTHVDHILERLAMPGSGGATS